ncbi:uncharacterized protein LOC120339406 [Styela clava]
MPGKSLLIADTLSRNFIENSKHFPHILKVDALEQIPDERIEDTKPNNQKEPLLQHNEGSVPWEKVGIDLCEYKGKNYLITVDYFSSFFEVDVMTTTTTNQIIICLKRHFARHGIPKMLISDCGRNLNSSEFEKFIRDWRIQHVTSSPGHQQANGKAESSVKIFKNMLKRTANANEDQFLALIEIRNTPRQDLNSSPSKMLFGRSTRSIIPTITKPNENCDSKRLRRKHSVKKSYDKSTRPMRELNLGKAVYFQHPERKGWNRGTIVKRIATRSYIVKSKNGVTYRRNRVHIRPDESCNIEKYEPSIPFLSDYKPNNLPVANDNSRPLISNDVPTRPRRNRKPPIWMKDYVTQ